MTTTDLGHAYQRDRVAPLPTPLRAARGLVLLLAVGTFVTVLAYLSAVDLSAPSVGQSLWVALPAVVATLVVRRLGRPHPALLRWGVVACALWLASALAAVAEGDARGLTQLLLPTAVLVLLLQPASRAYLRGRDLGRAPAGPRPPGPPPRRRALLWRFGAGVGAARDARDSGQGSAEYIGIFAAVAVVVGLVALAFGSPSARTQVLESAEDLVCAVTGGPGCGSATADGGDGSDQDGSGEDGDGEDGDGEDGSEDEGCSGFWGCAWEGVKQVGSGLFNIGKGLWDDLVGLWELFQDPSLLVDALIHLWNNPSDLLQLIWDDESREMWENGDYGGAIGRTIWNVGSFFIPGVNLAKIGAKGGKLGKLADLASSLGQARKLADDAADAADTAADAARRGDVDAATEAAEEARRHADEAAEEARRRGCPVAAGPATAGDGALALAVPEGSLTVAAVRPVLSVVVLLAGGEGCGDLTDAAREADEAADAADLQATAARADFTDLGDGVFQSPGGLAYGMGRGGEHRIDHVLAHATPNPNKANHTVFSDPDVLGTVDEAWSRRGTPVPGDPGAYVVDMGRVVGTAGETSIRVVVEAGSNPPRIVTAYPVP